MYFSVSVTDCDEHEYKLLRDIMRDYDPRIRPSKNASESLNVTFGLALAQIIDVVSMGYVLKLNSHYSVNIKNLVRNFTCMGYIL